MSSALGIQKLRGVSAIHHRLCVEIRMQRVGNSAQTCIHLNSSITIHHHTSSWSLCRNSNAACRKISRDMHPIELIHHHTSSYIIMAFVSKFECSVSKIQAPLLPPPPPPRSLLNRTPQGVPEALDATVRQSAARGEGRGGVL